MITFSGVSKRFGARDALAGVSFAVRTGAVTALVGPNGSGKTTLVKIALGLTRPACGSLMIGDVPVDGSWEYRRAIGYMPQLARFPEHLRVRDLLALVDALRPGATRDDALEIAFGLAAHMDAPLGTLSGGTRQKVNAVIAFRFRPSLLILDEPTAGLDPLASRILKDAILRARDEGRTVLISSHILAELEEVADDVAFLCDGTLRFAGSVASVLAQTGRARLGDAIAALMIAQAA
jgi:Cu-processing system ATP-binding protein